MQVSVALLLLGLLAVESATPRMVAYVNCVCGFGYSTVGDAKCLSDPSPTVNYMLEWEQNKTCPITHYVLSFLSFTGSKIQTDPGSIWKGGGGSTTDFTLDPNLYNALSAAQKNGKSIILSLGGETGSETFLTYWNSKGSSTTDKVNNMRTDLSNVRTAFENNNTGLKVNGYDVDIELGGGYTYGSDKYTSTRDLINAVPTDLTVAFVPQVGNGLCAAPNEGDPLNPSDTLGGQCMQPPADGTSWTLARLDQDCKTSTGSPRLDYFGIQYYNAGQAVCCGGGTDPNQQVQSTDQNYKQLANGWEEVTAEEMADPSNPWHQWEWYPGPWAAYAGMGSYRILLGKPGCQGCAGSDFLDYSTMLTAINNLNGKLKGTMGGIFWWDLCRLFGNTGSFCVSGTCQPSWGGTSIQTNLNNFAAAMKALQPAA